jgi:hypothetical protein
MATWDSLDLATWDNLYTWDDPDRNAALTASFLRGDIVMDAPQMIVDWIGDVPNPLLAPQLARDEYLDSLVLRDTMNRTVTDALGAPDFGPAYSTTGGSATDYDVTGGEMVLSVGSLSVTRSAITTLSILNGDVTMYFDSPVATGSGGEIHQVIRGRFQDVNNMVECRVYRLANSNTTTVLVRSRAGGVDTAASSQVTVSGANSGSEIYVRFVFNGQHLEAYVWLLGAAKPTVPTATVDGATWQTAGPVTWGVDATSVTNTLPFATEVRDVSIYSLDLVSTSVGAHPYALVGASSFSKPLGSSFGTLRPQVVNTAYAAIVNDISEVDFDVAARVRATTYFTGARCSFILYARYQDANNFLRFRMDFNTDQVMGWGMERSVGGSVSVVSSGLFANLYHDTSTWIWVRVQGVGSSIRMKGYIYGADRIPTEWDTTFDETVFPSTAGRCGWGAYLQSGNTNTLPYSEIQVETYWQGANAALDGGRIAVGLSLDDGMPSAVTNTANIGVNEAKANLLGSIETAPDIYYSTFRTDQPFGDLPRDVAGVEISAGVLADDGVRAVRLFTGRMADIPINDQSADLLAISATRLALSSLIQPPAVHGFFEGGEATWLIGYALFKCGVYVAPRPLDGCRLYLPMNGTTHSYIPDDNRGPAPVAGLRYVASGSAVYDRPKWIDGPFTAAPDLRVDSGGVRKVVSGPGAGWFAPGSDFLSQRGYRGRIEAWVKGIPVDAAGSLNPAQGDLFMVRTRNNAVSRYAALLVLSDRRVRLQINDSVTTIAYTHSPLPVDGLWHYIAGDWMISSTGATVRVHMDGFTKAFGSGNSFSNLPATEDADAMFPDLQTALPCAEIRISSGLTSSKADWADSIPFDPGAIVRRSILNMDSVAEGSPREAFELLSSLAQCELARTGFDELDRYRYLPLTYWAEPDQQIVNETLSTDDNIGRKFKPIKDIQKIYNQVALSYKETQVQETWVTAFQSSVLVVIPPGQITYAEAPFNSPVVELRTLTLVVMSGTALAAAPPSVSNAINYITLNDVYDGSGNYATSADVSVSVSSWAPGGARILIKNSSSKTWYLANNVNIPPLGIAAKAIQAIDASVSAENSMSIVQRGPRFLPVSMGFIQSRAEAQRMAEILVSFLASPRVTITSDVLPDVRRRPGQLYRVNDVDGTGLSRVFRMTGVSTSQDGADVQQAIGMEESWSIAVWGQTNWGEGIWGP